MKKILAKLNLLINELENNNFTKEADSLHKVFVKVAQLGGNATREFTNPGGPIDINAVVIDYTIIPDIENQSPLTENDRRRLSVSNKFNIFNPGYHKSEFNNLKEAEIYFAGILNTSSMPGFGDKNKELHDLVIENYALSVGSFEIEDIHYEEEKQTKWGPIQETKTIKYVLSYEVYIYYNGGYKDLILKGTDYTYIHDFFSTRSYGHLQQGNTYVPKKEDFRKEGKYDYDPKDFPPDPIAEKFNLADYVDEDGEPEEDEGQSDPIGRQLMPGIQGQLFVPKYFTTKNRPPEPPVA